MSDEIEIIHYKTHNEKNNCGSIIKIKETLYQSLSVIIFNYTYAFDRNTLKVLALKYYVFVII